jgi:site-specific recombinase XerD
MDVCRCRPGYQAQAGPRGSRQTKTHRTLNAAAGWKRDVDQAFARGERSAVRGPTLTDARKRFVTAAREGRALNKWGRRYKAQAIDNIEVSLRVHAEEHRGAKGARLGDRRITDIRRGDVQALIDDLAPIRSGSRVRSVVHSLRALYTWAQDREFADHDPAQRVRLPAMDSEPIERVAAPAEFAQLLDVLDLNDALAYAMAGYAFGRAEQIRRVRWADVNLDVGAIEWGVELEARKYDASRRVVPVVAPLHSLLRRAYLEAGRPDGAQRVCPPRHQATSGLVSTNGLAKRAKARWSDAGLVPITLQEARHTGATWLDAAGVSPKIASVLMGHAIPVRQVGAAAITLARYTHALPEDVERARGQLGAYLLERQAKAVGA